MKFLWQTGVLYNIKKFGIKGMIKKKKIENISVKEIERINLILNSLSN